MQERTQALLQRMKQFAVRVIHMAEALPQNNVGWVIGKQVIKASTSIGANYVEAQRASSRAHFVSILQISLREADETKYWLDLIEELALITPARLRDLQQECAELVAILVSSTNSAKREEV
jgi:four helix bundle protein